MYTHTHTDKEGIAYQGARLVCPSPQRRTPLPGEGDKGGVRVQEAEEEGVEGRGRFNTHVHTHTQTKRE